MSGKFAPIMRAGMARPVLRFSPACPINAPTSEWVRLSSVRLPGGPSRKDASPRPIGIAAPMRLSTLKTYLHREQRLLIGLAIGGALATLFIKLAGEMSEGETAAVDIAILKALRLPGDPAVPVGPSWLLGSMRDLTALGGVTVLTLVSLLAVTFLLVRGRWHQALYTAVATGGGAVIGKLLKSLFARERPEIVPHLVEVHSLSFPSGHSTNSAIVYLTLAVLIARSYESRRTRGFVIGVAALLVLMIGMTRVYLGVHFPSDVLAGWTVGAAWALFMGLIATKLQQRNRIEAPEGNSGPA